MKYSRLRCAFLLLIVVQLSGCAMVTVKSVSAGEYIAMKRGDILTNGTLSVATLETLRVLGLEEGPCRKQITHCIETLQQADGLTDERRLATLAEVWLQAALSRTPKQQVPVSDHALDAWLEAARHAYAYLFFTARTPGERAFEDRQTQVRDYYNYAVQQSATGLFQRLRGSAPGVRPQVGHWSIAADLSRFPRADDTHLPRELIPASSLRFDGLRSTYRRDGFGAELVAVIEETDAEKAADPAYLELPTASVTALIQFNGERLDEVLTTHQIRIVNYDPYMWPNIQLQGQRIPLAGNFTASYGLWLARSGFATQSLRTLLGNARGITTPVVYPMQPYDPRRRIILMLHGLASSPEAWVNVANEVLGDETLRQHYQVWQVYYPTNLAIAYNHTVIREAVTQTLKHFDPAGTAPASHDMVLIGHSMGGVLARLMVSTAQADHWQLPLQIRPAPGKSEEAAHRFLMSMLSFEPLPNVSRAIFIAAPHRGTAFASNRMGRWVASMIKLPATLLTRLEDVADAAITGEKDSTPKQSRRVPNSIDGLRDTDPFIREAATLPISTQVRYHSIIACRDARVALEKSDDGFVPYRSAHLDGAVSEKVITSFHSVQETPQAILEIRRILREHLIEVDAP